MRDYDLQEMFEYQQRLREVNSAPMAERKENCKKFTAVMQEDPSYVGERIDWLLEGHYGYGEQQAAERVLAQNKSANKIASLNMMIAALEWRCPGRMAVAAWKTLMPAQKQDLADIIQRVLQEHVKQYRREKEGILAAQPHGRCKQFSACVEHAQDPSVPSCKRRGKGRRV